MQYVEVIDGNIIGHFASKSKPEGNQYKSVNDNFVGIVGSPSDWFDWQNKGERIPDETLIAKGLREDFRGIYYSKETKEEHNIEELDTKPENDWTSLEPDTSNPFQSWDEEEDNWVINTIQQQKSELKNKIAKKKNELSNGDYKVIKAYELKTELDNFYPGESDLRQKLRIEINDLQEELGTITEEINDKS